MRAELAAAAALVLVAVIGVQRWEKRASGALETAQTPGQVAPTLVPALAPNSVNVAAASPYRAGWGEQVKITASPDHQYYVTAAVNNAPASFLVDTGASFVALRDSDARRAGIMTAWSDFTHPVRTANGETKAALISIRSIEIDGIRVDDVKAFILADDQLSVNLLGMSFLSKLESVEARGGELVLRG